MKFKDILLSIVCLIISFLMMVSCEPDELISRGNSNTGDSTAVVQDIPELIIYNYSGGNVEWVSIQDGITEDGKIADAKDNRDDIRQSNDTVYIQLLNISDTLPFTRSGNFNVVLKHDQKDKMYIKFNVKFANGLADVKWGSWMAI
ncbi:MAG: hypothetical protein LBR51_05935 [Bacteroidales bacterium]|jgi:hypothetical protein|nr:hypothetical protein [Bacteroidales bacterium]